MTSAVALFDIDYFKAVNDQHGHAAGDRVLREIAAVAYSELRGPFDRLGRWGGEEFVVLLSNVDMEKALSVCDRLRSSIEDHIVIVDGQPVSVTASFGLAMLPPNSDFDDMLEQADGALYESKAKGRNCVTAVKELTLAA
jgi:diguanylate cyclase (GGDEF)-like protein